MAASSAITNYHQSRLVWQEKGVINSKLLDEIKGLESAVSAALDQYSLTQQLR